MTNTNSFERKTTPEFDTAVRSLRTLRHATVAHEDDTDSRTILADVQHAVRGTAEASLRRVASLQSSVAFQPKALLGLLTYCYVIGTFSSADIEDLMRRDATFRHLCQGDFPCARLLKRFRRENRAAVRNCVLAVLERQNQRYQPPAGSDRPAHNRTTNELLEDADGRILKAMFLDSMEDEYD